MCNELYLVGKSLDLKSLDVGMTPMEVDLLLGLQPGTWPLDDAALERWSPSQTIEVRVRRLLEICDLATRLMDGESREWLRAPNPAIDGLTPLESMMRDPGLSRLRDALRREVD